MMSPPTILQFAPIYQSRVWGGRTLETRFGRNLPDAVIPYGESWEISARPEADSVVVTKCDLEGLTLTDLWADKNLRRAIFGPHCPDEVRFPLLCKILDCREKLSLQVHPPTGIAALLKGEPKTEIWYVADAEKNAELYVGVKTGATAENFRAALKNGTVEEWVHTLYPKKGDHILIESGRLHAIGSGLLIYEIQQNSDTTYRVYDWNRIGLDGQLRPLHVEESLRCINFDDIEPQWDCRENEDICQCEYFRIEEHHLSLADTLENAVKGRFAIVTVVEGEIPLIGGIAGEGVFFLVPHGMNCEAIKPKKTTKILITTWGGLASQKRE